MKTKIINHIKLVISDRSFFSLLIGTILLGLVYSMFVAISLQTRDIQVAVHYTIFGEAHFYKEKWFYLISFVIFGLSITIAHTILMFKVYLLERRQTAMLFGWLSIVILIVAWSYTASVLKIAYI